MKKTIILIFLLLAFVVLAIPARAQSSAPSTAEPLVLTGEQGKYPLGLHLEILEDPGGKLTIDEVASSEFASRFVPSQVEVPNFGFTDSAYWVRLHLDNETRLTEQWLLEVGFANMQYADLYTPLPGGAGFDVKQTGSLRPVSTRDVFNPELVFKLFVPTHSQQTYYLRFQNGASMTLPLTLWSPGAFLTQTQLDQMLHGLFLGALLILLAYNLFLLFSLREASYLYLVIFLASSLIFEASYTGYLEIYFIPQLYFLKNYYMELSFEVMFAALVLFSDAFLELKTQLPKFHRVNIAILGVWGVLMLLVPFMSYHEQVILIVPWGLASLVAVLAAGIACLRQGFRPARFFMLAWPGLFATIFMTLLVRLTIISSTIFSENAYRVGILWMAVCLSIALADRINLLKANTESANRDLRASEHRLSQILEGLPLGVVLYGKDHKPIYTNRRTIEILSNPSKGIQPDLSVGRTLAQAIQYFSIKVSGSNLEYPLENFPVYNALRGEPATADDIETDQGDRLIPLEIWASPIRDSSGNVESAVVALQDITQRRQAEAELVEYHKHLESLVEKRTAELSATNEQLNHEVAERKILERSLDQRIEWLSAINRIHQTIKGEIDLATAYEELSAKILQLLDVKLVFITRWDEQGEQPEVHCRLPQDGSTPDVKIIQTTFQKDSPLRREIELGKIITLTTDQAAALPVPFRECCQEHECQSLILAPIIVRHSVAGVLGVAASQPLQDFIPWQVDLVEKMAFDLVDLEQYGLVLDQSRSLATAEERNRLARELHDSVTQVLFSTTLLAEVLPNIWRRDPAKGLQSLEKLRRLTRGALAEMRTMLLELRPSAVTNTPLNELLAQLTEAITSRSGLPFQLFLEQIPALPEDVQTNFYRVAQEALNNVVKHAQATLVSVSLSAMPLEPDASGAANHEVKLVIKDDGVGYASGPFHSDHLGLSIMRERAASIHASLAMDSQPGYGTRVTLIWFNEQGKCS